jgi:hypothetical protein
LASLFHCSGFLFSLSFNFMLASLLTYFHCA